MGAGAVVEKFSAEFGFEDGCGLLSGAVAGGDGFYFEMFEFGGDSGDFFARGVEEVKATEEGKDGGAYCVLGLLGDAIDAGVAAACEDEGSVRCFDG